MAAFVLVVSMFAGCTPTETEDTTEATEAPEVTEVTNDEPVDITAHELLQNVNARKALAIGFDKEFIIVDIYGDKGDLAADSFIPVNWSYGPAGTEYAGKDLRDCITPAPTYDPDEAAALWATAKEELGFDTVTVELLNYDNENSGKVAEHIKEELERNLEGLTLTIKPMPFSEKLELADNGDFELNFAGWGPDYPSPLTYLDMWVTDGPYNETGWSNAEFDAAIETARTSSDATEVWEACIKAEEIITTEYPIIPLYQRGLLVLLNDDITNMYKHNFGADYTYKWTDKDADADGQKILNLLDGSDIPDMDCNDATDTVSFEVMNQVLEGLYRLSDGDVPILQGATEVTYADGAYTFALNQDAQWVKSDGTVYGPVTAADYVYSWDRLASEELGAQYGFMVGIAGIESYEAVDDYTLKVVAKQSALFEALMGFAVFMPVNEAFVESVGQDLFGTSVETTLYNGPFYLSEWELSSHSTMTKNANYWEADVVMLDEIYTRYIIGVDNNTAVQMYLDGEINRTSLSGENVALYRDRDDVWPQGETTVFYITMNINNDGE